MSKVTVNSTSGGVLFVLGLLLVALKLNENIDWSWWIVLLPFYAWPATILIFVVGTMLLAGVLIVGAGVVTGIGVMIQGAYVFGKSFKEGFKRRLKERDDGKDS